MKKRSLILILFIVNTLFISQLMLAKMVENPETPLSNNAGRQVKLSEILRIQDEGEEYYFKNPSRLNVAPDGSIFVTDDKQFLKFDKQGKFIANLQKNGEGPGEFTYLLNYQFHGDQLFINTFQPPKMLICDLSGKLIKEIRLNTIQGFKRVLGIFEDRYYYLFGKLDFNEIKSGLRVMTFNLYKATFDEQITDLKLTFSQRQFFQKSVSKEGSVRLSIVSIDNLLFVLENENSLFISDSASYIIKHVNLATGELISQFNRKYQSVPYEKPKTEENSRTVQKFKKEFFSDISGIALYKDKIWVFTSTVDKQKGVLVDLFSKDGKYVDNFYIKLPQVESPETLERRSFVIKEDFLYIVESTEDETPTIVKYKIEY